MNTQATTRTRRLGIALAAIGLAGMLVAPQLAAAAGAEVNVSFSVAPTVRATLVDEGIFVQTNTAWVLTVERTDVDGAAFTETVRGTATGSTGSLVPVEGLVTYTLVAE